LREEKDHGEASLGKVRERPPFLLPLPYFYQVDPGSGRARGGPEQPREATPGRRAERSRSTDEVQGRGRPVRLRLRARRAWWPGYASAGAAGGLQWDGCEVKRLGRRLRNSEGDVSGIDGSVIN
jgi:hypothetical protein